jgi:thymidylate kinase
MRSKQFVVIEGVIGAGKTALAEYLGETWNARLVLEDVAGNPYLEEFYRDRQRYAFQTQITFLLARYQQQQDLLQRDIFSPRVVSDYLFQKDRLFANVNLSDKELRLYDNLFPILERDVPPPDIVVYLQASTDTLVERVSRYRRTGSGPTPGARPGPDRPDRGALGGYGVLSTPGGRGGLSVTPDDHPQVSSPEGKPPSDLPDRVRRADRGDPG